MSQRKSAIDIVANRKSQIEIAVAGLEFEETQKIPIEIAKNQSRQEFINKKQVDWKSQILRGIIYLAAFMTILVFLALVGYILIHGVPYLSAELFSFEYTSENVSMMPAIINTLVIATIALIVAVPIGIGAAIYMVEYAKKGNRLVEIIQMASETLAGIPSIVYGLFGMLFFVLKLGWRYSLLSGACTLAIMVLPLIMRTTEEALLSVPDGYREGSFGLGAGKLRTIFCVVLPSAIPGILSGIILSTGRIVGETAALVYTAGTVASSPGKLFGSGRTLAVHMYTLSNEGMHVNEAYATAVILLVIVMLINSLAGLVAKHLVVKEKE